MMKANNQLGFININEDSIDKIIKDDEVIFERGFLREKTSTTLPTTFDGVGKDLKDYRVYGNTYQNSTKGINIFNINNGGSTSSEISIDNDDYVSTAYNNANGSVTHYSNFMIKKTAQIQPSTNYLIVIEILSVQGTGRLQPWTIHANSCINNSNPQLYFNNLTAGQKIFMPVTTKSEFDANTIYDLRTLIIFEVGQSGSITFRLSLLTDTTVTSDTFEYEPYTGGQPSPSPEFNQKIISCGDRTKNLIPTNVNDWEQGTISTSTGLNVNSTTRIRTIDYYEINNDTNYYISLEDTDYSFLNMFLYNSQKEYVGQYFTIDSEINGTRGLEINIPSSTISNVKYCRVTIRNLNNSATIIPEEISTIKPMIALGNTKLDFEPYGYKIPVNVRSENLFDKDDINIEDNKYLTSDGSYFGNSNFKVTDYIPIKSNTIYNLSPYRNYSAYECFYDENKTFISSVQISSINNTFTTPSNAKFIRLSVRKSDNDVLTLVEDSITNIYLDEPLRKIGDYADYIDFKNGKVIRQLGEVILDGSESWTTIQAYGRNYYAVAISNLLISNSGSNDALLYNNYYIGYKSNELVGNNTKDYGICRRNNNSQVLFRDKDQSILSDLTTWLSTHNNIMCYPLATPTEESITLPNIPTVDGNNTLNIETEITPSKVYIKYKSNS